MRTKPSLLSRHSFFPSPISLYTSHRFPSAAVMSAVPETATAAAETPVVEVDDNVKFGFNRTEMYTEKLAGTAIAYDRHVILCYKTHETWPARVESSDFPKLLAGALKARKNDIPVKTLLTICEGREGTELADGDVLLFPEMVKYRGLKEADIRSFVDEVVVNVKPWSSGVQETMTGSHVFVCAHNNRDRRCGVCGPILIKKFKEEAELRGLKNVSVNACSHVGGHKYAGNLIIYSVQDGKVCGHWYGYVTPDDVPALLDQHIGKGEIIERIWRGQMGAPALKNAQRTVDQKLLNRNDSEISVNEYQTYGTKDEKEKEKENDGGCCQGANGFSCCRDEKPETETKTETEKEVNKPAGKLDFLTRKWEQSEVFTAAALVGAVVTVAVAYSYYR
ncbi:hypothetical protein OSB04_000175, partial [Centaurea solstitialis]